MRPLRPLVLLPLALAGCGKAPAPVVRHHRAAPAPAPPPEPDSAAAAASAQAADFLRLYYRRIEAGDYDSAWRMRSAGQVSEARFAANFKPYRDYHALVGLPSLPAKGGGWTYVEVPVMITGRFLTGAPFGSAGRVTLRRADRAGAGWAIYTG